MTHEHIDMIIDCETAYRHGFSAYGFTDTCPYGFDELKAAWWRGWWQGLAAVAAYRMLALND